MNHRAMEQLYARNLWKEWLGIMAGMERLDSISVLSLTLDKLDITYSLPDRRLPLMDLPTADKDSITHMDIPMWCCHGYVSHVHFPDDCIFWSGSYWSDRFNNGAELSCFKEKTNQQKKRTSIPVVIRVKRSSVFVRQRRLEMICFLMN